ncbi:multi-drug resistance protein, partial [Colletotrichum sublineola]
GQRQCVVLVRALIRDPKVLILDEAIALLDSASEHRIQMGDGLERAARGIIVIAISRRLHTVRNADLILVVRRG